MVTTYLHSQQMSANVGVHSPALLPAPAPGLCKPHNHAKQMMTLLKAKPLHKAVSALRYSTVKDYRYWGQGPNLSIRQRAKGS
jgi:hypothetical protein